ncbi:MAG: hypothetical protein INR72_07865 [Williamsia herbipolensis]|uniref:Aminoglycoside phosphotransferase domain-containing protein n=1 Tax=Williamsia serinedens TaxID=391736 RepID=A0ABT1H042_9NOCA|nr:hypothetical protein [Williamsia serinedens]MBE7161148.1 hypothetical protein [Williamsia herbipolensis]MCP2159157.1 hypothetical protein [Williamsia serinedens]
MTVISETRLSGAVRTAERVLSSRAGVQVDLTDPVDLGGSGRTDVVRVRVAPNPVTMDRTLVVKVWPVDEPGDAFARELASYKYATALPTPSRPGPHLIAFDHRARVIVLSDLGHGRSMAEMLAATDVDAAHRAVSAWGQALGRMHAATVGGEQDFAALLRHGPDRSTAESLAVHLDTGVALAPEVLADDLGVGDAPEFVEVLRRGAGLVREGDHRAFSPSDVGPPNILLNDDGVQFMDYEWGGFRDATLDIAYACLTCTSAVAPSLAAHRDELVTAMIDAWRSEVQSIWPSLGHDGEMNRKMLVARTLWVWMSTLWMLPVDLGDDSHARGLALRTGDPTVVVGRWRDLAEAGRRVGVPEVADCSAAIAEALDAAWLR